MLILAWHLLITEILNGALRFERASFCFVGGPCIPSLCIVDCLRRFRRSVCEPQFDVTLRLDKPLRIGVS